ncbi:MAG: hypothetical protein ABMB14_38465, partial [Myxococcota bacterium]
TGWWEGDPVAITEPGFDRTEAPSGTLASSGTTLTSVASCPPFEGWEVLSEHACDPAEPVTTTEPAACGCRAGAPGDLAPWTLGWAAFAVLRRRSRVAR